MTQDEKNASWKKVEVIAGRMLNKYLGRVFSISFTRELHNIMEDLTQFEKEYFHILMAYIPSGTINNLPKELMDAANNQ